MMHAPVIKIQNLMDYVKNFEDIEEDSEFDRFE